METLQDLPCSSHKPAIIVEYTEYRFEVLFGIPPK